MNVGSISGGTNAGWRRVKEAPRAAWTCPGCNAVHQKWIARCPNSDCRHIERP